MLPSYIARHTHTHMLKPVLSLSYIANRNVHTEAPTFLRVMIRAVHPVTQIIPSLVSRVVSSMCLSPQMRTRTVGWGKCKIREATSSGNWQIICRYSMSIITCTTISYKLWGMLLFSKLRIVVRCPDHTDMLTENITLTFSQCCKNLLSK